MTSNGGNSFRQTASDGVVSVERRFEVQETGVRCTVTVRPIGEHPAVFRIEDPVPEGISVNNAEFEEGTDPLEGHADETGVSIEGIVRPDEEETFVYSYALSNPEEVTEFPAPSIDKSIRMDSADAEEEPEDEIPLVRGARTESIDEHGGTFAGDDRTESGPSFLRNMRRTLFGHQASTKGAPDPEDDVIEGMQFGNAPPDDADDDEDGAANADEDDSSDDEDLPDDLRALFSDTERSGEAGERGRSGTEATESLVVELTEELRSGDVTRDEVEALREELRLHRSESTDVRLSYLQARLDRLAAYTDALEELIDKHGTGTEIIDGLLDQIDDLRGDLDEVVDELEQGRYHRLDNQHRIEELEERSEAVEGQLDRVREDVHERVQVNEDDISALTDRLEEQHAALEASIETLREETEQLRTDMPANVDEVREDLQSSLDQVEEAVERNTEFRRRLAEIAAVSTELSAPDQGNDTEAPEGDRAGDEERPSESDEASSSPATKPGDVETGSGDQDSEPDDPSHRDDA